SDQRRMASMGRRRGRLALRPARRNPLPNPCLAAQPRPADRTRTIRARRLNQPVGRSVSVERRRDPRVRCMTDGRRLMEGASGRRCLIGVSSVIALAAATAVAAPAVASARAAHHGYRQINLVADRPGRAQITDPNLVNAWGLSHGPNTPLWVSDNGADVSTLY